MPTQPPKLGPLPRISAEKLFEQQSLDALRSQLPADKFICRDERLTDYGVDVSLELIHESCPTNIRCLLQLKARHGLSPKADGSISLSVETSNLNYLLNSPSSIVVLFDGDNNIFYWCFAQVEMHRLHNTGISLTAQTKVTLHFTNTLPDTTNLLFDSLFESCMFARGLREKLIALPPNAMVHVNANQVIGPIDADKAFFDEGWGLANEGNIDELLKRHALLPDETRKSARVQLIIALGYYSGGRPLDSRAALIEPTLALNLCREDTDLVQLLRMNTDFLLGEMTRTELGDAAQTLAVNASPLFRLHYEVNFILSQIATRDQAELAQLQTRAARTLVLAATTLGIRHPVSMLATLAERQIAAQLLLHKYIIDSISAQQTGTLGELLRDGESPEVIQEAAEATLRTWLRDVEAIAVATTSWPSIHAEAQFTACTLRYGALRVRFLLDVMSSRSHPEELIKQLFHLEDEIGVIIEKTKRRRADDIATRFGVLQLAVIEMFKSDSELKVRAQRVAAYCKLTGLKRYEAIALTYVNGETITNRTLKGIAAQQELDRQDRVISSLSASERDDLVRQTMIRLRLPPERSNAVRDDVECLATAEEERITFCRHLHVIQDTRHTLSKETAYAKPFDRAASCELLGRESLVRSPEWRSILTAFKAAHCSGCKHRAPRSNST
jgi:hypothetical protein